MNESLQDHTKACNKDKKCKSFNRWGFLKTAGNEKLKALKMKHIARTIGGIRAVVCLFIKKAVGGHKKKMRKANFHL